MASHLLNFKNNKASVVNFINRRLECNTDALIYYIFLKHYIKLNKKMLERKILTNIA